MQGKTHLVIGTALAVTVLSPTDVRMLGAGVGAAALGSVISDIDSGHSKAGQKAAKGIAALMGLLLLAVLGDAYGHFGIFDGLLSRFAPDAHIHPAALPVLFFALLCMLGILSPHRSFMHSFLGGMLLTACVWKFSASLWPYFAIGFGVHLLLDVCNQRGMRLLFPLRRAFCLGWFKSNGVVDKILFAAGLVALIIRVYLILTPQVQSSLPHIIQSVRAHFLS